MFDRLIDVLLQFVHLFQFFFVVSSYEGALVLRFGNLHRRATPGFHLRWPFGIERVLSTNVVTETITVGPQSLTTQDDKSVVMSSVVTFHIDDVEKFLLEVEGGHQVIEDSAYGTIAQFVQNKNWDELRKMDISNELTKKVRRRAAKYGVAVDEVQVSDFTHSRSIRLIQPLNHRSHHGL